MAMFVSNVRAGIVIAWRALITRVIYHAINNYRCSTGPFPAEREFDSSGTINLWIWGSFTSTLPRIGGVR
jgi:hypothetical protein